MEGEPFARPSGHVPTAVELLSDLSRIADRMAAPVADVAAATRAAYESDWRQWEAWCDLHDLAPLPVDPEMVRLHVADLSTQVRTGGHRRYRAATIERHVASLAWHSRRSGGLHDFARHPRVAPLLATLREQTSTPTRTTRPFAAGEVQQVITAMDHARWPHGVAAARDTLLVLLGHTAALRRTAAATVSVEQALTLPLPETSTPSACARCALHRWVALLSAPDRTAAMTHVFATGHVEDWAHRCTQPPQVDVGPLEPSGPLLRPVSRAGAISPTAMSTSAVNRAFKRRLAAAGIDPARYGYGSLRAGASPSRP